MKKYLFLLLFMGVYSQTFSCEICGCSVGNFYAGLLPKFKTKFIGIRYQYNRYHSQLASDPTQFSNDYYKTTELWGGYNINKHWQLLGFVPYVFNKKISDDGIKNVSGLGDITLIANYTLFENRSVNKKHAIVEHQFSIGGGIKLATGKYYVDLSNPDANIGDYNSQLGTGSTDFILAATYNLAVNKWGLNNSVNYKINTSNADSYYFGNRFSVNSFIYYRLNVKSLRISPNIGLLYQQAAKNYFQKNIIDQTGGYYVNAATGIEINYKKIAIGFNTQLPLQQNFANKQTTLKAKGLLHISFAF